MKIAPDAPPQGTVRDWVDERAKEETVAFIFPELEEQLTWRELRARAYGVAAHLTNLGVSKGESVAIMSPNGPTAVVALYACLCGGFRATMINLVAGQAAVSYALEHSEARFAFVDPSAQELFSLAAPGGMQIVTTDETASAELYDLTPKDDALLMYTSGTTGTPKGVVHSHESLLAGGWTTAVAHKLTPADHGFCVLPIYHINGLCVTVMGTLVSGGALGMASKFSASRFWGQVDGVQATWFSVVPTIISHLLHGSGEVPKSAQRRLRFGRSASAPLSPDVQTAFEDRFGVPIIETMGLTETAAQILSNPLPPATRKIGSPGVAFGNQVSVRSLANDDVAPGAEGEILIKGPNVMRGYLKNADATKATFSEDGWLRTGDLGRIDEDGYVFVTGRLKELIIKGGENIAPREIDEALYAHPDVVEAAAFAVPCSSYGERVEAAVKLSATSETSAELLLSQCRDTLGTFKAPDKVYILDDLPKGPSGKIQRRLLAERFAS